MTPPPPEKVWLLLWRNSEGSPISLPNQSMTITSNSVQAGLAAYRLQKFIAWCHNDNTIFYCLFIEASSAY